MLCTVVVHMLSSYFPGLWDELCMWHVTRDYMMCIAKLYMYMYYRSTYLSRYVVVGVLHFLR